ncbi:hypothetical protein [Nocardia bovistercoris]|uniref:Uncharacterized protein n=1 Tax=Nocardia bovistercoris TaxID=2785916 RepID=A0A931N4I2_9NOCA|nr:hypothetical protein [Nocardia bovistercoris]MBH0778732.1 hypothetical protein [Nocardia bovistercoris]
MRALDAHTHRTTAALLLELSVTPDEKLATITGMYPQAVLASALRAVIRMLGPRFRAKVTEDHIIECAKGTCPHGHHHTHPHGHHAPHHRQPPRTRHRFNTPPAP